MRRCCIAFVPLLLGCESEPTVDATPAPFEITSVDAGPVDWHEQVYPKSGEPRAIGSYTAGCVQGAVPLMPEGRGYQVMRLDRGRFFGHPADSRECKSQTPPGAGEGCGKSLASWFRRAPARKAANKRKRRATKRRTPRALPAACERVKL